MQAKRKKVASVRSSSALPWFVHVLNNKKLFKIVRPCLTYTIDLYISIVAITVFVAFKMDIIKMNLYGISDDNRNIFIKEHRKIKFFEDLQKFQF